MKKLYGVTIAMITPFTASNKIDKKAVCELTDYLIDSGVNCLYPCGTTGEMFHMTERERMEVAETVVERAAGRVTVYIHTGAMYKDETIRLSRHAKKIGADGIGIVTPTYFPVNQRELIAYYTEIVQSIPNFPVYLYNIPQYSSNDISADTTAKIIEQNSNIVGIKYSFDDMHRLYDYVQIKNGFSVLSGSDRIFLPSLAMGCDGIVSGFGCVFPELLVNIYKAYKNGDIALAQKWQRSAYGLIVLLRYGSNMAFFKTALEWRGISAGHMRSPQLDLCQQEKEDLLKELGKISALDLSRYLS